MTRVWQLLGWTFALVLLAMPVVAVVNGWIGAERWPIRTGCAWCRCCCRRPNTVKKPWS